MSIIKAPSLVQPNGLALHFYANRRLSGNPGPLFFLSSIGKYTNASDEVQLLTVTYFGDAEVVKVPPSFSVTACRPSDMGVPYIKEVGFSPASNQKLYFEYGLAGVGAGQQCVLKKVINHAANAVDTTLIEYSYATNSSGYPELAARTNVSDGGITESYDYDAGFSRYAYGANQGLITQKLLDPTSFKITSSVGDGPTRDSVVNGASGATCPALGADTCCNPSMMLQTQLVTLGSTGDGSGAVSKVSSMYYSMAGANMSTHEMVLYKKSVSLLQGLPGSMSPGTEEWIWRDATGGSNCNTTAPGVLWAKKNKRDAYVVEPHTIAYPGTPPTAVEKVATMVGASDRNGTNALQTQTYQYNYGGGRDQRLSVVSKPSALASGGNATTYSNYVAGRGQLFSTIREGYTKGLNGVSVLKRFGTFYRTARGCVAPTTVDANARTVRAEGPCEVASSSSTSCLGTTYPVTEFVYEPGTANDNTSGRLLSVSRFPNYTTASCGKALVTQYTSYSPQGQPTTMIDEAGVIRTYSYSGELVTSMTVEAGSRSELQLVTTYDYEGSNLTKTTYPLLNYERICYRTGADTACAGGTLTSKVQWRAKYDSAGTWTERIDYEYAPNDGTLSRQVSSRRNDSGAVEVRLERRYQRDAQQRLTFMQSGSGSVPSMQTNYAFDGADNRIATSTPFAGSGSRPAFCGGNSTLCSWMKYDRADRLVQMDSHPDGTLDAASQRTCVEYDQQGNVRRVAAGCAANGPACPINLSNNTGTAVCTQGYVDYEVDDFGNTIAVTFPWTGNTASRGTTRFEYDGLGNVVKKQTAEMASAGTSITTSYDRLGRLLEVRQLPSNTLLYRLGYDDDETVDFGCPAISGPDTYSNGRLTIREDSFGKTWYLYDRLGHVTQEVRSRAGAYTGPACKTGTQALARNPHTFYTYNANGALTSITYPHGRTVSYVYPSSGEMDRPTSITATTWNGSAWLTPSDTLIDKITWEPYGELRAYQFNSAWPSTPSQQTWPTQWVEYLRQGSLETTPGSSTCAALSANGWGATDGSGRLRGVFVSEGTFALGSPTGNIFKQVYTWNSDQLVNQQTCHRNAGNPLVETFAYDILPRLTSKAELGTSMTYAYDKRNNRTQTSLSGPFNCSDAMDWGPGAWQLDLPSSRKWGPANGTVCNSTRPSSGKYNYSYDRDGRRVKVGDDTNLYSVQTNYTQDTVGAGLDSVFKSATVNGSLVPYSYFYDAQGRRRAKTTPWSTTDEYFYDTGHQMLSDRGSNNVGMSATEFPEDDYVWLGGRPVAIMRSKFNPSTWVRTADGPSNWCNRDSEQGLCGTFMLVTDYLGKPVATFDRGGTSGTAFYEGFGFANRREWRYGSPHNQTTSQTLTTIDPQVPPGFDGPVRLLLSRSNFSGSSSLVLAGTAQTSVQGNRAHAWSNWQYAAGNTWPVVWNGTAADYGVDIEAYEVRAKQSGAWWAWTPLRYPGQYYDPETELNENWNRSYDPSTGRYLSPEPMLQQPEYVPGSAIQGLSAPAYSYALNNPLRFADSNGLSPLTPLLPIIQGPPIFPQVPNRSPANPRDAIPPVMEKCYPWTELTHQEIGGLVCRNRRDGQFIVTMGAGIVGKVNPWLAPCPAGYDAVSIWHLHPPQSLSSPNAPLGPFAGGDWTDGVRPDIGSAFIGQRTPDMPPGTFAIWMLQGQDPNNANRIYP